MNSWRRRLISHDFDDFHEDVRDRVLRGLSVSIEVAADAVSESDD